MKKAATLKQVRYLAAAVAVLATGSVYAGDIVVIVGPTSTLTKDQISDVFLGKNTNNTPVDLPESSPIRASFYSKVTGKETPQVKAAWARLVFSGKAQPPKELPDAASVKKAVAADPKAVGYIDKSSVDASVKVLSEVD